MNNLTTYQSGQLPDTPEDLATWDRFLSARLPAYRKLLHNVKSWDEATEEERRILRRAQEETENLIDIRVKLGELYRAIPEESGKRTDVEPECNVAPRLSEKQQFKQRTGLSDDQAKRYQKLANNPEAVELAKEDAKKNNDVVSQQKIMKIIAAQTPPTPKPADKSKEAKERHREYEQKKSEGVVSIQDAMQDREDKQTIARDLYKDLLSLTQKSYWIGAMNKAEDFERVAKIATDRELFAERIRKMIAVLNKLLEVLSGS